MTIRSVVVIDDLREFDIRPPGLFKSYIDLLRRDVDNFFSDRNQLVEIACPGCLHWNQKVAFVKLGLRYLECDHCFTVYLSPRPTASALDACYQMGEAAKFWDRVMMKETDKRRREHVFRLRLDWLLDVVNEFMPRSRILVDWKSKYGSFLEEVQRGKAFDSVVVMSPTAEVKGVCQRLGIEVDERHDGVIEASAVTAFEVLEREFNPRESLQSIYALLSSGGLLPK